MWSNAYRRGSERNGGRTALAIFVCNIFVNICIFVCYKSVCSPCGTFWSFHYSVFVMSDRPPNHSNTQRILYTEESAKVKARHEVELSDLAKRSAESKAEQLAAFEKQVHSLSKEIFKLNEQNLEERKQNEQLRTRLQMFGHGGGGAAMMMRPSLGVGRESMRVMPAASMCKCSLGCPHTKHGVPITIPNLFAISHTASLIKMEDEEGEQFTNTYLNDLMTGGGAAAAGPSAFGGGGGGSGRHSPPSNFFGGSDSVPLSELKKRNSMVPRHLRSSYAVQYTDNFSTEDDIKVSYQRTPPKGASSAMERTFVVHRSSPDMRTAAAAAVLRRKEALDRITRRR